MADQQHIPRIYFLRRYFLNEFFRAATGLEFVRDCDAFAGIQIRRHNFRRLPRAHQRTGQNHIETQLHRSQCGSDFSQLPLALRGERAEFVVCKMKFLAFHREAVAQEKKVHADKIHFAAPFAMPAKCLQIVTI